MSDVKIIKNITSSPFTAVFIEDIGQNLPQVSFTIPEKDYLSWASSVDAQTAIDDNKIILNDGFSDLSKAASKAFLKYPGKALNQRFAGDTERGNGFSNGLSTQEAIEQSKTGVARDMLFHLRNATGSKISTYDPCSGTHIDAGPEIVIDLVGNIVTGGT